MGNHRRSSRLLTALLAVAVGVGGALVPVTAATAADDTTTSTQTTQSVETGVLDPSLDRADQGLPPQTTQVYSESQTRSFRADFIVSDANFFDSDAMTTQQVQTLLNDKGSNCSTGVDVPCLKNFSQRTSSKPADAMCSAYTGAANESAASIFTRVGAACGINPLVLVVLVQKERSLVTTTKPTANDYNKATGFNCPDTAPCDPGSAGFFTQVYSAARQFKRYANPPGSGSNFTAFAPGKTAQISYYPDTRCGSSPVTVRNQATSDLYYYTPYQPNSYALTGQGDASCATYGNINFWFLFSEWNPAGTLANAGIAPVGQVDGPQISNGTLTANGWTVDPTTQQAALATTVTITAPNGTRTVRTVTADGDRGDISAREYPAAGRRHGYTATAPASATGTYTVCASAASVAWNRWVGTGDSRGPGSKDLGCSSVQYQGGNSTSRDVLTSGSELRRGQQLTSADGGSRATMQSDGNLAVYSRSGLRWAAGTQGDGDRLVMQSDGNAVVYTASGRAIWSTETAGQPGARMVMQNDGNLVVYSTSGRALWASESASKPASGDTLPGGGRLTSGQKLRSSDGTSEAVMQTDGNFVVLTRGTPRWATGTSGAGNRLEMQSDGNAVVYTSTGASRWATNSSGNPGARMVMQNDGNLVIYSRDGRAIWASRR